MRIRMFIVCCIVASLCACRLVPQERPEPPANGKFLTYAGSDLEIVPDAYLVMFDDAQVAEASVAATANSLISGTGGRIVFVFDKAFRGFAAENLDDRWAAAVSARREVRLVRKEFRVYGNELRGSPWDPPPWGLDRIDQRANFRQDRDYRFKTGPAGAAPPVPIYVLDNGVYKNHDEFMQGAATRVTDVADLTGSGFAKCALSVPDASHGTSIASIAAGKRVGIVPTSIMNVKVLDRGPFGNTCTHGTPSQVAMGLESVLKHMQSSGNTKAVVNLSVGWNVSAPDVILAVQRVQSAGAVVIAAAGNENTDAALVEPANISGVVAVGATTEADARLVVSATNGSNYGNTVALWAPGENIRSATWPTTGNASLYDVFRGTSFAAPHAAGAVALLWQQNPAMTPAQVANALRTRATRNMLTGLGAGSLNALLHVGEAEPAQGKIRRIARSGNDGDLRAVLLNPERSHVLLAGGDSAGPVPFAYATEAVATLGTGTLVANAGYLAVTDCDAISSSGYATFFGCMRGPTGAREAMVIAADANNPNSVRWQAVLGPASSIDDISYGYPFTSRGRHVERVFVVLTRPKPAPATGSDVVVMSLDADDGRVTGTVVLSGTGFQEAFHRGVQVVLVETVTSTASDLVVASYSDPAGPAKTFV